MRCSPKKKWLENIKTIVMPNFDESFYDNLAKFDIPFIDYFNNVGGSDIRIDYVKNEMYIMGKDQSLQAVLCLGKSAKKAGLEKSKLFNDNHKVGDYKYGVLLNGFNKMDWLFAVKVVEII
jgi:hypothetical protein